MNISIDSKTAVVCSAIFLIAGVTVGGILFNISFMIFLTFTVSFFFLPVIRLILGLIWFVALEPLQDYVSSNNLKIIIGLFKPYEAK